MAPVVDGVLSWLNCGMALKSKFRFRLKLILCYRITGIWRWLGDHRVLILLSSHPFKYQARAIAHLICLCCLLPPTSDYSTCLCFSLSSIKVKGTDGFLVLFGTSFGHMRQSIRVISKPLVLGSSLLPHRINVCYSSFCGLNLNRFSE